MLKNSAAATDIIETKGKGQKLKETDQSLSSGLRLECWWGAGRMVSAWVVGWEVPLPLLQFIANLRLKQGKDKMVYLKQKPSEENRREA